MKLVQKLPAALAIACLMMMSSCSKDDVQTPEPKAESANTSSNLKVDAAAPLASIASTQWYTGIDMLPADWSRNADGFSSNQIAFPVGVSSMTRLWGDRSIPFTNSMSLIQSDKKINTFITVTTSGTTSNASKSSVKTKIKHLTPGKTYRLTVYVGSSLAKSIPGKSPATYAKKVLLSVQGNNTYQESVVNIGWFNNSWYKTVFTFKAYSSQMDFAFSASPEYTGQFSYAHLLIAEGAIIEEQ